MPAVFPWLQQAGNIDSEEMDRVFNMGLGLVLVVSAFYANRIVHMIEQSGHACWEIGQAIEGQRGVEWTSIARP